MSLSFLILSIYSVSSQQTSQGVLAGSLESLSDKIQEFSTESTDSLTIINQKLDDEQEFKSDTSESLIKSKISELEDELQSIAENLESLQAALEISSTNCGENLDCKSCTGSEKCVWCNVDKICVNGDFYGPMNGECGDYNWAGCTFPGCEEYLDCQTCIGDTGCGWCTIGHFCYEGSAVLKGDCDFEYYYHAEGNTQCPEFLPMSSVTSINTEAILQQKIDELLYIEDQINFEIYELEEKREDIVKEANKGGDIIQGIEVSDFEGIIDVADQQAIEEDEDELLFQELLWDSWANNTIEGITEDVDEDFDDIIIALEKFQDNDEVVDTSDD